MDSFLRLGECTDNSPGQLMDKVARELNLQTFREDLRDVSGGRAVEVMAAEGDPEKVTFTTPLLDRR